MKPTAALNVIDSYPAAAKTTALAVRELVLATADQLEKPVEETLKWGQPAWLAPGGSTVRIDWSDKTPDTLALHFNCKSKLVETFRVVFHDELMLSGNRTVLLPLNKPLPTSAIEQCLSLAFRYHSIKHLPLLGC